MLCCWTTLLNPFLLGLCCDGSEGIECFVSAPDLSLLQAPGCRCSCASTHSLLWYCQNESEKNRPARSIEGCVCFDSIGSKGDSTTSCAGQCDGRQGSNEGYIDNKLRHTELTLWPLHLLLPTQRQMWQMWEGQAVDVPWRGWQLLCGTEPVLTPLTCAQVGCIPLPQQGKMTQITSPCRGAHQPFLQGGSFRATCSSVRQCWLAPAQVLCRCVHAVMDKKPMMDKKLQPEPLC